MATDKFTNFCVFGVVGSYTDADLIITVDAAAVSLTPAAFPYWLVWWDASLYTTPTADPNREIIQVDALVNLGLTAELTVIRGEKGTTASAKLAGSQMLLAALADQIMPANGLYHRVKSDGSLQFRNIDTGLYHTFYLTGAPGSDQIFISAGEV